MRVQPVPAHCPSAGTSVHRLATSWRSPATAPPGETALPNWVYWPLMEWTCEWAAGQNDDKAICDAIIRNVGASGMRYGVAAPDVRRMILGKVCDVRRLVPGFPADGPLPGCLRLPTLFPRGLRTLPRNEEQWCAIVIRQGGLNQAEPTDPATEFHDNDTGFPISAPVPVLNWIQRRYRFWACLAATGLMATASTLLEHGGRVYLYDACFGKGPIEIDAPLPPADLTVVHGALQLKSFKERYLDGAVEYMLGSLHNGPQFFRTILDGSNGMTIRTRDIPESANGVDGVTFRWGD